MRDHIKESDWKVFRELSEVALDRAFERGAAQMQALAAEAGKCNRARFWDALNFGNRHRRELPEMFDDASRSRALFQLARIASWGLLTADEMARFSEETRGFVEHVLQGMDR